MMTTLKWKRTGWRYHETTNGRWSVRPTSGGMFEDNRAPHKWTLDDISTTPHNQEFYPTLEAAKRAAQECEDEGC